MKLNTKHPATIITGVFVGIFVIAFVFGIYSSVKKDGAINNNEPDASTIQQKRAKQFKVKETPKVNKKSTKTKSKYIVTDAKMKYDSKDIDLSQIVSENIVKSFMLDLVKLRTMDNLTDIKSNYNLSKHVKQTVLPDPKQQRSSLIYFNHDKVNAKIVRVGYDYTNLDTTNYKVIASVKIDDNVQNYMLTYNKSKLMNVETV